ncbi:FMN-binding domain [Peptoniphilus sp. ING2-D1G]|nr:FMN-binding domain [Peptoniphilus sp. ING2-D1G]
MKKILIFMLLGLIFILGLGVFMFFKTAAQVSEIDKTPVDIEKVRDGKYIGKSETALVKVEVEVSVEENKIEDIKIIKHECGKGEKAENIVATIIENNDVEVDGISGATVSGELIKDAIRKALRKGLD